MYSRKLALTMAKQFRTCPPVHVRNHPAHRDRVARHRRICPCCCGSEDTAVAQWEKLADAVLRSGGGPGSITGSDEMQPGQLRVLKSERGGWHKGLYYNPPLVLVLDVAERISDEILVAQTYPDTGMAGPGDLILALDQTDVGDLFVECWNNYTLKAADLDPPAACLPDHVIEAVRCMADQPDACPDWAVHPIPFTDHDPRVYFRELETEVGYFFASRAAGELMAELEGGLPEMAYGSVDELVAAVRSAVPDMTWHRSPETPDEVIALARFAPDRLPLAAADADQNRFPAKLVFLEAGRIREIRPVQAVILGDESSTEGRTISGRITDLPADLTVSAVSIRLRLDNGRLIRAVDEDWDHGSGSFFAEFAGENLGGCPPEIILYGRPAV